ncbi:MAG: Probable oxidoreductase [uncultured Sulfurovum sp.]|uniref:Probable oxidoreductase n=1 Tax=uncultured Sulfurovum sp. TaxID=269237 RepID=A0A6S6SJZ2_9BACT|nr:MAG: Probable oxidoreductase [uncultured Sulfurovum sp.]
MKKTILITGSTDGIGFETAKALVEQGHNVLIHGRNEAKLNEVKTTLLALENAGTVEAYRADFSDMKEVEALAKAVMEKHASLDVLINNAGIFKTANPMTKEGLDVRFMVNTLAPYLLSKELMPLLSEHSRIVNLSSAAQAPVSMDALLGKRQISAGEAYAQSKLALTMFTYAMAEELSASVSSIIAVNPASLLASKMVKEGYGITGKDITIGSSILTRMVLDDAFANIKGDYFDNDIGSFTSPHPDGQNTEKCKALTEVLESMLKELI